MSTKQLTRGAMVCAIYGALLLINQQTALTIESAASWIFVFPVLIYTAQSTVAMGVLVAIAMGLMSFIFGGFTTWFYSWCSILIGLLYGIGLLKKWKNITNFVVCFVQSIISNALMITVWATLFGMDLAEDFEIIHKFIPFIQFEVYVLFFIFIMSLLQAFCIHLVAIMICMRLKIPYTPLKPLRRLKNPRIIGELSLLIWFIYCFGQNMIECSQNMRNVFQILYLLDCVLLDYFGVIFLLDMIIRHNKNRKLSFLVIFGAFVPVIGNIWMILGELDSLLQIRSYYEELEMDYESISEVE